MPNKILCFKQVTDPRGLEIAVENLNTEFKASKLYKYLPVSLALVHGLKNVCQHQDHDLRIYCAAIINDSLGQFHSSMSQNNIDDKSVEDAKYVAECFICNLTCASLSHQLCFIRVPDVLFRRIVDIQKAFCGEWRHSIHLQAISNWLVLSWLFKSRVILFKNSSPQSDSKDLPKDGNSRWLLSPVIKSKPIGYLDVPILDINEVKPNGGVSVSAVHRLYVRSRSSIER